MDTQKLNNFVAPYHSETESRIETVFMKNIFLVGICLWFWACEDCIFTSKNSSEVAIKFFTNGAEVKVAFDSIKTSVGGDVFFLNQVDEQGKYLPNTDAEILTQNSFKLVLNPARDSSEFIFHWAARKDTLAVSYQRQIAVVTPDCGFDQRIDNLIIIKNTFPVDSIFVIKPHLEINDDNNIEIYLAQ